MAYRYVLKQRQRDGRIWISPEVFEGSFHDIRRAVAAGYLIGEPRWAETALDEPNPEFFLFGLDRAGRPHETGTGSADFTE